MANYSELKLPRTDEDAAILKAQPPQMENASGAPWIFIIGLHRSGTTFLQQSLIEHFNLMSPSVYHLLYYEALLTNHQNGSEGDVKDRLASYFEKQDLHTRLVDNIALTPNTCEEIGFLLARLTGSLRINEDNLSIVHTLGHKFQIMEPDTDGVLIKNPWDTRTVPQLSHWFPNARFIFIKRDFDQVLRSQLNNALHYGSEPDPYLDLLIKDIPSLKTFVAGQRILYRCLRNRLYLALFKKLLTRDIKEEMRHYQESLRQVPDERKIEIDYQELITDTNETFQGLQKFLQLTPTRDLDGITARPRRENA